MKERQEGRGKEVEAKTIAKKKKKERRTDA